MAKGFKTGGSRWRTVSATRQMPASVLKVREKTCQPRKNRSASTARKRARKCAPRCATRNPGNTRSKAASRRSQSGSPRREKKGQRFQRRNREKKNGNQITFNAKQVVQQQEKVIFIQRQEQEVFR